SVVVCSDTIAAGQKEDKAGKAIIERLEKYGISIVHSTVIPDEKVSIEQEVHNATRKNTDLLIFTGGTGMSSRDITPDTLLPLLDREMPGVVEAIRNYGQDRTPFSMLSRSVAGVKDKTVILAL